MSIVNPILISRQRPQSRAWAIKAMCAHCMGCTADHLEPGFRDLIRECSSNACPLHAHRPYVDSTAVPAPSWRSSAASETRSQADAVDARTAALRSTNEQPAKEANPE